MKISPFPPPDVSTGFEKDTAIDLLCPLCLAGRGDLRHVCHSCQEADLPRLREALWDSIEGCLEEAAPLEEWSRPRQRAAAHPKGWKGSRRPVASSSAAALEAGLPAERGHDLGYRGVVPRGIAQVLGGPESAQTLKVVRRVAEVMGAIRARYMKAVKAEVASRRREAPQAPPAAPGEGGMEPATDTAEEPAEDPGTESAWKLCQGPQCTARAEKRGEARGLVARNGLCWR